MNNIKDNTIDHAPYWHANIGFQEQSIDTELSSLPDALEIIIVGSGFTGLSAALTLARAGKKVAVLDSGQIGSGASSRNGGLLGPSFHKLGMQGLTKKYGQDTANAVLKESLAGFDWLVDFIGRENIGCDLQHCGRFRGALTAEHYTNMAKQAESLAKVLDYPVTLISKSEQHLEVGTDKYCGGVLYNKDASLHPAKLVQGLIEKLMAEGVSLIANAKVSNISAHGQGFKVKVGDREIATDEVLIATNGYTGNVTPNLKKRIIPIRSSMIATQSISKELMRSVSPKLHTHGGTDRLVLYYRPSPDGTRLLFGGRALSYADKPDEYTKFLHDSMVDIFPQLQDSKIDYAWSGLVAYSFDHVPHLGKMDGMYYAMGYCGSGVARANYLGHKIAMKMLGNAGDTIFEKFEFNGKPFYNGNPWFMPAVIRWHSVADKFGW